jgi:RNA polymerase subunit RPABC4/transcription elongation factor Spt4
MAKEKICKNCKTIYEDTKCPNCQSEDFAENFKGKITMLNPEQSEIAQHLNIKKKGSFAIKIG